MFCGLWCGGWNNIWRVEGGKKRKEERTIATFGVFFSLRFVEGFCFLTFLFGYWIYISEMRGVREMWLENNRWCVPIA